MNSFTSAACLCALTAVLLYGCGSTPNDGSKSSLSGHEETLLSEGDYLGEIGTVWVHSVEYTAGVVDTFKISFWTDSGSNYSYWFNCGWNDFPVRVCWEEVRFRGTGYRSFDQPPQTSAERRERTEATILDWRTLRVRSNIFSDGAAVTFQLVDD